MLYSRTTIVLSFDNKVVKVQHSKFFIVSSVRMLHLVSEVGFCDTPARIWSTMMATQKLEELTRDELQEEFYIWNQSVRGSRAELLQRLTDNLEKEDFDPAISLKVQKPSQQQIHSHWFWRSSLL